MSTWARVKTVVKNTEVFKECCEKHGVGFELNKNQNFSMQSMPVYAILKDQQATSHHNEAYLCVAKNAYHLVIDNDPNWSSITARVGKNGGIIMRDYAQAMVSKTVRAGGGTVLRSQEQKDKSLLLYVGIN